MIGIVFALQQAFNPNDAVVKDLYDRYVKGELMMSELKKITSELIVNKLSN